MKMKKVSKCTKEKLIAELRKTLDLLDETIPLPKEIDACLSCLKEGHRRNLSGFARSELRPLRMALRTLYGYCQEDLCISGPYIVAAADALEDFLDSLDNLAHLTGEK